MDKSFTGVLVLIIFILACGLVMTGFLNRQTNLRVLEFKADVAGCQSNVAQVVALLETPTNGVLPKAAALEQVAVQGFQRDQQLAVLFNGHEQRVQVLETAVKKKVGDRAWESAKAKVLETVPKNTPK